jgi:hypothetical protein
MNKSLAYVNFTAHENRRFLDGAAPPTLDPLEGQVSSSRALDLEPGRFTDFICFK